MGLFDRKKKEKNEVRRSMLLVSLENAADAVDLGKYPDGMDTVRRLRDFQTQIQNQPQTLSNELVYADALIVRYIKDITEDISKGNFRTADVRLSALANAVAERGKLSGQAKVSLSSSQSKIERAAQRELQKAGKKANVLRMEDIKFSVGDLYSDEQLYDINLSKYQDEVNRLQAEVDSLSAGRRDMLSETKLAAAKRNLQIAQARFQKYSEASVRDATLREMEKFNEEQKQNISSYSIDEAKDIMGAYTAAVNTKDEVAGALDSIFGNASSSSAFSSNASSAGFAAESEGISEREYGDIKQEVDSLARGRDAYQNEISNAARQMKRVGQEALALMERRKTADNAERRSLESQIRSKKTEYANLDAKIKLLEQRRIKMDNELSIAQRILANIEAQRLDQTYGSFAKQDMSKKVMDLRAAIQKGNEVLDESNTYMAVGLSEEYNTDSLSDIGISDDMQSSSAGDEEFDSFEKLILAQTGGGNG